MAVAKGYWRETSRKWVWREVTGCRDELLIDGNPVRRNNDWDHQTDFDFFFSVRNAKSDIRLTGFIRRFAKGNGQIDRHVFKVYHDANANERFNISDPLIGKFVIPATDPWYQRARSNRSRGISGYLASSDGIGKAKFKYKTVKVKDDDGNVTGERFKITDMIFKERRPPDTWISEQERDISFSFTDNILYQANPDL